MNTLTINSKATQILAAAAERARTEKPLVKKTSVYGIYAVLSSDKTKEYKVTCNSETREITCSCPARKPCKHIAAIVPIHSYIARQKQEAERAATEAGQAVQEDSFIICGCGRDGFSFFNGEWYCIECIKEMAEAEALELACKDCQAPATSSEGRCEECTLARDAEDLFGSPVAGHSELRNRTGIFRIKG